tara:strand:+ start:5618 stop:6460 length:843 start_codon:yes stop_codon:yes gene_type:complete
MWNGKILMQIIKNFFVKSFRKFGYEILGRKKIVKHNSFDAIHAYLLKNLLNIDKEILIFDVGANEGDSITRFRNLFTNPQIHSFEPTEDLFKKIKKNFNLSNLSLNNYALGKNKEKRNFYIYNYHRVNSFYPMENNSKYKKQRTKNNFENEKVKLVDVVSIDDYCLKNKISRINLLKIDTQGSEAEVLLGAKNFLGNQLIDIIELEYIFGIAHQNANSLYDIEKTLNANNYKLIAIEKGGNILSFSNYQTNLIYVKQKIFDEIKKFHEKNIDVKNVTYSV